MGTSLAVVSQASFHLEAGEEKQVSFPVVMPTTQGTYPVHIGVFSGGQSIGLYKATEDVVIVAPSPTYNNTLTTGPGWTWPTIGPGGVWIRDWTIALDSLGLPLAFTLPANSPLVVSIKQVGYTASLGLWSGSWDYRFTYQRKGEAETIFKQGSELFERPTGGGMMARHYDYTISPPTRVQHDVDLVLRLYFRHAGLDENPAFENIYFIYDDAY
jgi:hypothetical protein